MCVATAHLHKRRLARLQTAVNPPEVTLGPRAPPASAACAAPVLKRRLARGIFAVPRGRCDACGLFVHIRWCGVYIEEYAVADGDRSLPRAPPASRFARSRCLSRGGRPFFAATGTGATAKRCPIHPVFPHSPGCAPPRGDLAAKVREMERASAVFVSSILSMSIPNGSTL